MRKLTWQRAREVDYEPAQGLGSHCTNSIHLNASGWCPDCDSTWDRTTEPTEAELAESMKSQGQRWVEELAAGRKLIETLKSLDPRPVVQIVETRKRCRDLEELIAGSSRQPWKVGGFRQPHERE